MRENLSKENLKLSFILASDPKFNDLGEIAGSQRSFFVGSLLITHFLFLASQWKRVNSVFATFATVVDDLIVIW